MVPFYKTEGHEPMLKRTSALNLACITACQLILKVIRAALPQASRKSDGNDFLESSVGPRFICLPLIPESCSEILICSKGQYYILLGFLFNFSTRNYRDIKQSAVYQAQICRLASSLQPKIRNPLNHRSPF